MALGKKQVLQSKLRYRWYIDTDIIGTHVVDTDQVANLVIILVFLLDYYFLASPF